jgi:hypothetical protein
MGVSESVWGGPRVNYKIHWKRDRPQKKRKWESVWEKLSFWNYALKEKRRENSGRDTKEMREREREGRCREGEVLETERDVTSNLRCAAHPETERNVNTQNPLPPATTRQVSTYSSTNNSIVLVSSAGSGGWETNPAVAFHSMSLWIRHLHVCSGPSLPSPWPYYKSFLCIFISLSYPLSAAIIHSIFLLFRHFLLRRLIISTKS